MSLRSLIPAAARERVWLLRNLDPSYRALFVQLQLARMIGRRRDVLPHVEGRAPRVLFVCFGNIIRSPMGEVLLRKYADAPVEVRSAGLAARAGKSADPRAVELAPSFGVRLDAHEAQPLDAALVAWADVILVMDWRNEVELIGRFPDARAKVLMLGAWRAPGARARAISDPYTGSLDDVRRCYALLAPAVRRFADDLAARVQLA